MTTKRIEFDEKCQSCKGTGLYVGFAEHDGMAVVCSACKGTGCVHFVHEYKEFTRRQTHPDAEWVVQCNLGIGIGKGGGYQLNDFGGMDYCSWLHGIPFPPGSEMRRFICPAWWYQAVDYDKKPRWDECSCGDTFTGCNEFGNKAECWARWDAEIGEKGEAQ